MDCFCDCGCTERGEPDFCAACYAECVAPVYPDMYPDE
jgi:hypothetical protein